MGWGYCGKNRTTGAEMGYNVEAKCDDPGCEEIIDHGLAYVCGGMHEGGTIGCGRYFCGAHMTYGEDETGQLVNLCFECERTLEKELTDGA